jgi:CubicO group peptidase (beta-lactamase class C family)
MTRLDTDLVLAACHAADSHLAARQRILRIPGVQAAVAVDGEVVWETAHGLADIERGVSLQPRHVFRIASHSKTFTAIVILQLVDAGKLRLDDRLGAHVAGLPESVAAVTLREALGHGGGITRDGTDADHWLLARPFPDAGTLVAALSDDSAVRPRNERFKYSNIAYSLLGLVIEAVTGASYSQAVSEGVIDRIGLQCTTPDLDVERVADYATGYTAIGYADQRLPIEHIATGAMAAATGFASTAADTARYLGALRPGDGRLLNESGKRLAHRVEWQVDGAEHRSYGLGFEIIDLVGRQLVGHSGGFPGFITRSALDPETGLSLSVLTNSIDGPATELATAVYKLIALAGGLHRKEPPHAEHGFREDLPRFAGSFANIFDRADVLVFGDRVWLTSLAQPDPAENPIELCAESPTRLRVCGGGTGFGSYGEPMDYEFADDGSARAVRGPGGISTRPLSDFTSWLADQDRVTLPGRED